MRKFQLMFGTLVLGVLSIMAVQAASAQGIPCSPTGVIEQQLADEHGEALRDEREANVPGGVVFLWTNGSTGTYSILINPQHGMTCLIDYGQSDSLKELEA